MHLRPKVLTHKELRVWREETEQTRRKRYANVYIKIWILRVKPGEMILGRNEKGTHFEECFGKEIMVIGRGHSFENRNLWVPCVQKSSIFHFGVPRTLHSIWHTVGPQNVGWNESIWSGYCLEGGLEWMTTEAEREDVAISERRDLKQAWQGC